MNLLQGILQEKGGELVRMLTARGFSNKQAERFVPVASRAVVDAIRTRSSDLDMESLGSKGNATMLVREIDIDQVARESDVPPDRGASGLIAMLPALLGFLQAKAGGGSAALAALAGLGGGADDVMEKLGGGAGDALGKLGKLGGGLPGS